MKTIKMIACFAENGVLTPMKFQLRPDDGEFTTVKVEKVIDTKEERLAGNRMIVYSCQSIIDGLLKQYDLKYEIGSCKWYLYKI